MSQRHKDYYGFVKTGFEKRERPAVRSHVFWSLCGWKWWPKDCFLKILKIENGIKITLFITAQHLDPLKTVPGTGFEQTWKFDEKSIGKSMVSDGPKPLKSIKKTNTFSWFSVIHKNDEKRCQRGPQKSGFGIQNGDMGFQFRLILWFLKFWGDSKKSHFLDALPKVQTNRKISPRVAAERSPERRGYSAGVLVLGARVPRPSTRATK